MYCNCRNRLRWFVLWAQRFDTRARSLGGKAKARSNRSQKKVKKSQNEKKQKQPCITRGFSFTPTETFESLHNTSKAIKIYLSGGLSRQPNKTVYLGNL